MTTTLLHPTKTIISAAEMQARIDSGLYLCQRKFDGELAEVNIGGATILAERMKKRSGGLYTPFDLDMFRQFGEWFAVITLAGVAGESLLGHSTRQRWGMLQGLRSCLPANVLLIEPLTKPEHAKMVMDEGGEGVAAHAWGASWGFMEAHKAEGIWLCTVTAIGGTQAAEVRVHDTGAICRVKLGGGRIDQCRVGSVLRIAGMGLTDKGAIREPKPCSAWIHKF